VAELAWGAGTHPGQVRAGNEDHLHASNGVYVVADGMGGHEAGEVASELAVERIRDALTSDDAAPTAEAVVEAISNANGDIFRAAIATPGQAGMGTTVTAIAVIEDPMAGRGAPNIDDNDGVEPERVTPIVPKQQPEALVLVNVGDSRTYLFRHNRLRRVTVDHSYVQELVSTGHITDDEARTHPRRNIITRALGIEPDVKVDWWTLPLVRGDRFVLCSDGLVDEIPDEDITATLIDFPDPQKCVDSLIDQANIAGGRDNITVIVVDVLDGENPPDPTQELDLTPTWADESDITLDDIERIEAGIPRDATTVAEVAIAKQSRRERKRAKKDDSAAADDAESESGSSPATATETPPKDGPKLKRAVGVFIVLALLVASFVALAAWARRGYFVDFDDQSEVIVFQGKPDQILIFGPTAETNGSVSRDDLTLESAALVDEQPTFSNLADAILFIRSLDLVADADNSASDDQRDPQPDATEQAPATTITP
jgi:serine/threonine protein phosphatase PrpC